MSILNSLKKSNLVKACTFEEKPVKFISTGCYTLNILFSGELFGGIQIGRMSSIVAPPSLGKSFVGLKVAKNAQQQHDMEVLYFDTEIAYDQKFAKNIGVDIDRMLVIQNNQIEDVQQIVSSTIKDLTKEERNKLLIIIDSWGGLVTSKTIADAIDGKDVTDMTIAKKKNSLARILNGLGATCFVVNQTYDSMNMYEPLAIGGGKGLLFCCSAVVMGSSKAKSKDGDEINGAVITAVNKKGRLAVENSRLKYLIRFEGGIHQYYGLLEDALDGEFVTKPSMGWYTRPFIENDKKWREKEVWENAKEFWTPIFEQTDFPTYIEKKYSFKHNSIFSDITKTGEE